MFNTTSGRGNEGQNAGDDQSLQLIPRVSLKDMAIKHIREAIERGELKSGEVVTELGLAKRLGVAQPTIREALLELEFLGFIERHGPRKTRITKLTSRMIDDIYHVRTSLEILAAELLAGRESADLAACWSEVRRMEETAAAHRSFEFYQADLAFHRALWKETGNESLIGCLELVVPRLMTFSIIQRAHPPTEKLTEIAMAHRQLLLIIGSHDVAATRQWVERSMQQAWLDDSQLLAPKEEAPAVQT
jgi:DNA-binding GntR family transcriptional regulator